MGEHLTESDWEQIREFAKTPAYERSPEILSGSDGREDEAAERERDSDTDES